MLATWNLGPCLAAGNACVLKPSELAPLTSTRARRDRRRGGLPPGVLNIITGLGATGARWSRIRRSTRSRSPAASATGRNVMATAAQLAQASDARARRQVAESGLRRRRPASAQRPASRARSSAARDNRASPARDCWSNRRIAADFIALLLDEVAKLKIGDPARRRDRIWPADLRGHRERVHGFVTEAVGAGRRTSLRRHGAREIRSEGFYYLPTVLDRRRGESRARSARRFSARC